MKRPSNTIADAEANRALTPKEVSDAPNIARESELRNARKYINYNLEHNGIGCFWIHEDYSQPCVDQIETEYKAAGWIVTRSSKEIMHFQAFPGASIYGVK